MLRGAWLFAGGKEEDVSFSLTWFLRLCTGVVQQGLIAARIFCAFLCENEG